MICLIKQKHTVNDGIEHWKGCGPPSCLTAAPHQWFTTKPVSGNETGDWSGEEATEDAAQCASRQESAGRGGRDTRPRRVPAFAERGEGPVAGGPAPPRGHFPKGDLGVELG